MLGLVITKSLVYILLTYVVINIAYSLHLKHIVIIDVMTIAAGFVLRALAGVVATGVGTTSWFILCIFMLALFLGLAKRYGELAAQNESSGKGEQPEEILLHDRGILFTVAIYIIAIIFARDMGGIW